MRTCCQTSALSIFVKSLTEVHFPVPRSPVRAAAWPASQCNALLYSKSPYSLNSAFRASAACSPSSYHCRSFATSAPRRSQEESPATTVYVAEQAEEPNDVDDTPSLLVKQAETRAASRRKPIREKLPSDRKPDDEENKPRGRKTGDKGAAKSSKPASPAEEKQPAEEWGIQKAALREKFPEGWNPRKKLSPDALVGIRALHARFPDDYPTEVLAKKFEVSPEAIRRILRSKWAPSAEEDQDRQRRWFERGKKVWTRYAALGMKPPSKWRQEGIVMDPSWHGDRETREKRLAAQKRLARTLI